MDQFSGDWKWNDTVCITRSGLWASSYHLSQWAFINQPTLTFPFQPLSLAMIWATFKKKKGMTFCTEVNKRTFTKVYKSIFTRKIHLSIVLNRCEWEVVDEIFDDGPAAGRGGCSLFYVITDSLIYNRILCKNCWTLPSLTTSRQLCTIEQSFLHYIPVY